MYVCFHTTAVSLRFESAEVTVSEGACLVNLTIEKDGETTVDSSVLFSTVQSGSAVGKLLYLLQVDWSGQLTRTSWPIGLISTISEQDWFSFT